MNSKTLRESKDVKEKAMTSQAGEEQIAISDESDPDSDDNVQSVRSYKSVYRIWCPLELGALGDRVVRVYRRAGPGWGSTRYKGEPKTRIVRSSRPKLSLDTLTGARGIHTIQDYFKDINFGGSGLDLDEVIRRPTYWTHPMYPNYTFDDVVTHVERIGKKKTLQVHNSRYCLGLVDHLKEACDQMQNDDEEEGVAAGGEQAEEPFDEFGNLLEQIAISKLATRMPIHKGSSATTPAHYNNGSGDGAVFTGASCNTFATPSFNRYVVVSTPYSNAVNT
ncbi:protein TIPIN homolog [Eurosta solidaginis]|uniref:protein TIPIN homolog n=1 Tax=Eurosta solidaginis TaxID=178769 RepID=UPI003531577B